MNEDVLQNIIVIKRDGKRVSFDEKKIAIAIKKGFDSIEGKYKEEDINKIYTKVIDRICKFNTNKIKIEEIQDLIEVELNNNHYEDVYISFKNYRDKRAQSREIFLEEKRKHKFLKALEKIGLSTKEKNENYKINQTDTINAYGKTVSEEFANSYLIKKRFSEAHEKGDIYIHNMAYYPMGTTESVQIDLNKLFENGFIAEPCSMREPQTIMSYAMLTIIAIHKNQQDQSGNQSIPAFDYYMSTGVLKSFKKIFKQMIYDILEYTNFDKFIALNGIEREIEKINKIDFDIEEFYRFTRNSEELKRMFNIVYNKTMEKINKETYQAMEAFVHDLNSLCSKNKITINLGTDTSKEGRMISENLFKIVEKGIGNHKQPISPIIIFKIKKGVNFNKEDINYDLYKKACELAVNTNNVSFSFIDSQCNFSFYKEGDFNTEVAYFEDGTRIIENILDEDKQISSSRGVISHTTINLPRIGLNNRKNEKSFFEELEIKLDLVKDQLLERMEIQNSQKIENFPFLMQQNVWIDSEKIKDENKIKRVLKQGILQISFIGLKECVQALCENEIIESNEAEKLSKKILKFMNEKCKQYSKKYNLNFYLKGEINDEVALEFLEYDKVIFGKVKNVTDKIKYSSSFNIGNNNEKKMEIEAYFQEITNGGHLTIFDINKKITGEDVEKILIQCLDNEFGFVKFNKI